MLSFMRWVVMDINFVNNLGNTIPQQIQPLPRTDPEEQDFSQEAVSPLHGEDQVISMPHAGPGAPGTGAAIAETPDAVRIASSLDDAAFQEDLDRLTSTRATIGNTVDALIDGQNAIPEFLSALNSATSDITYQSFEFLDDHTGGLIVDTLIKKAKEGVKVRVVVDAIGSRDLRPFLKSAVVKKLEKNGIEVRVFNRVTPKTLKNAIHRDHRKAIVIDGGKVAFIGGMNTAEAYLGENGKPAEFHDAFARVTGPAAGKIQDIFCKTFKEAGGALSRVETDHLYRNIERFPEGGLHVRVVNHIPNKDLNIQSLYVRMIEEAKDHVYVENSYPMNREMIDALSAAARRGVDVRYIYGKKPGFDLLRTVTENKFSELMKAGVKIYQYPRFVHTKSLSVDGKYASIGSSNVDNYALRVDREAVAMISDKDWVSRYEQDLFQKDMPASEQVPDDPNAPFWKHNLRRHIIDAVFPDFLE
jgi:cardiolipin synthase A/B